MILKRSRDFLLYTKKETSRGLYSWLNTNYYFYLPRIFYERKYTITWLLWNATSRNVNMVVKLTYFWFDCLRSTKTHIIIMATMKTGMICTIRCSYDDCRVIGTRFDGLVFRTFLSQNATLYFWCWFSSFQLELARPNYINRKIEPFGRFLVMQKASFWCV